MEQVLGTTKCDLESDKTYLRDNNQVRSFFFIVFLALRIRFRTFRVLKDHSPLGKISVNEVLFELSKMERVVEKSGTEYFAAIPKKVERIVDLFRNMISNQPVITEVSHLHFSIDYPNMYPTMNGKPLAVFIGNVLILFLNPTFFLIWVFKLVVSLSFSFFNTF